MALYGSVVVAATASVPRRLQGTIGVSERASESVPVSVELRGRLKRTTGFLCEAPSGGTATAARFASAAFFEGSVLATAARLL